MIPALPHESVVLYAIFDPTGQWLATVTKGGTIRIWDAVKGMRLAELNSSILKSPIGSAFYNAVFSRDGRALIFACGDGSVRLWHWHDPSRPTAILLAHDRAVVRCCVSPDGLQVASASLDRTAKVAMLPEGRMRCPPLPHDGEVVRVAFSPDGQLLATGTFNGVARLWNPKDGRMLTPPMCHAKEILALAFSQDGSLLATGSGDGIARVWDVQSGQPVCDPLQNNGRIQSVHFSADGRKLYAIVEGYAVNIWDLQPPPGRVPVWLPHLAEALAGYRLRDNGIQEPVSIEHCVAIQNQLATNLAVDSWSQWARWFVTGHSDTLKTPDK